MIKKFIEKTRHHFQNAISTLNRLQNNRRLNPASNQRIKQKQQSSFQQLTQIQQSSSKKSTAQNQQQHSSLNKQSAVNQLIQLQKQQNLLSQQRRWPPNHSGPVQRPLLQRNRVLNKINNNFNLQNQQNVQPTEMPFQFEQNWQQPQAQQNWQQPQAQQTWQQPQTQQNWQQSQTQQNWHQLQLNSDVPQSSLWGNNFQVPQILQQVDGILHSWPNSSPNNSPNFLIPESNHAQLDQFGGNENRGRRDFGNFAGNIGFSKARKVRQASAEKRLIGSLIKK